MRISASPSPSHATHKRLIFHHDDLERDVNQERHEDRRKYICEKVFAYFKRGHDLLQHAQLRARGEASTRNGGA